MAISLQKLQRRFKAESDGKKSNPSTTLLGKVLGLEQCKHCQYWFSKLKYHRSKHYNFFTDAKDYWVEGRETA